MNDGAAPDSKRQRSELFELLQEISSTQRELECAASDACGQSIAALNNAFQRLVSQYLQPAIGLSSTTPSLHPSLWLSSHCVGVLGSRHGDAQGDAQGREVAGEHRAHAHLPAVSRLGAAADLRARQGARGWCCTRGHCRQCCRVADGHAGRDWRRVPQVLLHDRPAPVRGCCRRRPELSPHLHALPAAVQHLGRRISCRRVCHTGAVCLCQQPDRVRHRSCLSPFACFPCCCLTCVSVVFSGVSVPVSRESLESQPTTGCVVHLSERSVEGLSACVVPACSHQEHSLCLPHPHAPFLQARVLCHAPCHRRNSSS